MTLLVLRIAFVVAAGVIGGLLVRSLQFGSQPEWFPWAAFFGALAVAAGIVGVDVSLRRKRLDVISAVYFGLAVGLFLAYIIGLPLAPLLESIRNKAVAPLIHAALAVTLCYGCISLLLQTRDDFRFIIPYVEFAKQVKGARPCVLDTSALIDGRIADLAEVGAFDQQLVAPGFVVAELQAVADSSDRTRRQRGRRGLDVLNRLRDNPRVDLKIDERTSPEMEGQPVDMKLVLLARELDGRVVTNDYNLNKVAQLHGVGVLNLNDLANALKPSYVAGESLEVRVIKPGEGPDQGVGYLDDGTMIVIEGGRSRVNDTVRIAVTSVLQTSAGRMVFGKIEEA
jgi:uncharacterized protein YacL